MTAPKLLVERVDRVTVLTINRPQVLNAIDSEVSALMSAALTEFEADDDQWVAVLTGAGARAFSAGADLTELRRRQQPDAASGVSEGHAVEGAFGGITRRSLTKPILGAINGMALGGGAEIAFALDLLVAAEHATFGLPEVKRGVAAGAGGLLRLPAQLPLKVAMQVALTGEQLSAADAHRFGLVNALAQPGKLMAATMDLARSICANGPLAVRASKAMLLEAAGRLPWDVNDRWVAALADTADAHEGVAAFAEKRPPVWRGR